MLACKEQEEKLRKGGHRLFRVVHAVLEFYEECGEGLCNLDSSHDPDRHELVMSGDTNSPDFFPAPHQHGVSEAG